MRKRTKARECTIQLLYQSEMNKEAGDDVERELWNHVDWENEDDKDQIREFSNHLFSLIKSNRTQIDKVIESCADHWTMDRMAVVDRNILRLGVCEILFCKDVPTKVAINESIELGKRFGDDETSKFVNGILDKVAHKISSDES